MGSLCDKESNMGKHGVQEKAETLLLRWFASFPFSLSLARACVVRPFGLVLHYSRCFFLLVQQETN